MIKNSFTHKTCHILLSAEIVNNTEDNPHIEKYCIILSVYEYEHMLNDHDKS